MSFRVAALGAGVTVTESAHGRVFMTTEARPRKAVTVAH